jgi:Tol biopolymer transport system component
MFPRWSHDGKKIAFTSDRDGDPEIYVMNADGSNIVQLTNLKGFAGVPVYAPDEKSIVLQWRESNDWDDGKKWRVCMMNADGSNFRVITSGEASDQVPV